MRPGYTRIVCHECSATTWRTKSSLYTRHWMLGRNQRCRKSGRPIPNSRVNAELAQ
jgi:hypothetical protein